MSHRNEHRGPARGAAHAAPTVPLTHADVPDAEPVLEAIRGVLASGMLTNGKHVRELEDAAAARLGVNHCVAVASCTSGLMLVMKAASLSGDVVVPSFTFAATAHAVVWNGLRPLFADIDPGTLTLDPDAVRRASGVHTSAILATHTFGTPADVDGLEALAREMGLRLFFDAAHAFGSMHGARPIGGFGDAEVFSLSPTKVLVAGEGGIIATNDDLLAERCRIARDYGNPGDYDCRLVGLNARMSELHAIVGRQSLRTLDERIAARNEVANAYQRDLSDVPGITMPQVTAGNRSTYKDFTILVEPDEFGTDAATLAEVLRQEGIDTRRYYTPPVHEMQAYRSITKQAWDLPVTDHVVTRVLTLPLWSSMGPDTIEQVVSAIRHAHARPAGNGRVVDVEPTA